MTWPVKPSSARGATAPRWRIVATRSPSDPLRVDTRSASTCRGWTISDHVENVDFYINEYLLYEGPVELQDGIRAVDNFLGYWFIRKAMWASESSIKSNAASLKKFYTFLHSRGLVSQKDSDDLKRTIKDEMPEWLATVARYNDPSITDMDEVWEL